ncbi:MAG: hypothetical protein ACLP5H_03890 [Desulfomonilaceae bacterium]
MKTENDNQQQDPLNEHGLADVCIFWDAARLAAFFPLLQKGFLIKTLSGTTIRAVLCEQLGVAPQYLDERVNTIFLDGKAVDDVDSAIIKEGSVLALSAAMPGFVGAAFRKGGYYALMRKNITHVEDTGPTTSREGFFLLKLYNFVAKELGPLFLESGIWLRTNDVKELFRGRPDDFWSGCRRCTVDGREVDLAYFLGMQWLHEAGMVRLRVLQG